MGAYVRLTGRILLACLLPLCCGYAAAAQSSIPYSSHSDQKFIWNGSSLMPLYSNGVFPCDRWEIWYFKQGDAHTPGYQWGADDAKTSDSVLEKQKAAVAFDHQYAKFFGAAYPSDSFVHDNYLGPICISETALSARPNTLKLLDSLGESAGRVDKLIERARSLMQAYEEGKPGEGNAYLWRDRTPVEEYLHQVEELPEKLSKTRELVMEPTSTPLTQIEANLSEIERETSEAEARLPSLPKLANPPGGGDDICLTSDAREEINCDSTGCDIRTIHASCNQAGANTVTTCILNHHTGQSECSER
jgi:hypothetical protein